MVVGTMSEGSRRFPPPWRADKIAGGYVIRDANGQAIAYLYSRENEAEARQAKVLTADEARRIASTIARLPELLAKGEPY
jgi:K+/H+ antiporter YhaU regulatory subunit KhtT